MKKINENLKQNKNIDDILEESYDEALKNEEFKTFVSKIKLKREQLKKYTSLLEESSKEYYNCQNCPGILECKNKLEGYAYLPKINNESLEFTFKPCKYKKKLDKEKEYQKNTIIYNMPEETKNASMKKIYKTDKKRGSTIIWLTEFMKKYKQDKHQKGLYLCGNFGSGKSYLISAMFNELAKEGIKSAAIFWPDFLTDLKSTFNSPIKSEFKTKYDSIKKAPLLLIDDIGAESVSPWSRDEILCPILQYRMDEKLPTFFTSNLDLKSLENHLSITSKGDEIIKAGRIISRIKQLTEYQELISKNLRE
ncbi:MAG: primosomal protein DnaI [Bacilli bacterium]|nr:primosomal protein DnaI [Bacilli bacterium]